MNMRTKLTAAVMAVSGLMVFGLAGVSSAQSSIPAEAFSDGVSEAQTFATGTAIPQLVGLAVVVAVGLLALGWVRKIRGAGK